MCACVDSSAYLFVRHEHAYVPDEVLCPALDLLGVVDVLEARCGVRVPDLLELRVGLAGVHCDVAVLLPARVREPFADEGLEHGPAAVFAVPAQLLHARLCLHGPLAVRLAVVVGVGVFEERVAEHVLEVCAPEVVAAVDVVVDEVELGVVEDSGVPFPVGH
eukprot:413566-Rhodomonas_salina.1